MLHAQTAASRVANRIERSFALYAHLTTELAASMQAKPALRVSILMDASRDSRGGPKQGSSQLIQQLLSNELADGRLRLLLYTMPQNSSSRAPNEVQEVSAVSHLKFFAFDDDVVLSGANLSSEYFTTRQDRYLHVRNCPELAQLQADVVDALAPSCTRITPVLQQYSADNMSAEVLTAQRQQLLELFSTTTDRTDSTDTSDSTDDGVSRGTHSSRGGDSDTEYDTLLLPTVQHAALSIAQDSAVTAALLSLGQLSASPWQLHLATAYLNPPEHYLQLLAYANTTVLSAGPSSHGFAAAKGLKAAIPLLYRVLHKRVAAAGVDLHEYSRPGWTFHAKGIWGVRDAPLPVTAAAVTPDSVASSESSSYSSSSINSSHSNSSSTSSSGEDCMFTVAGSSNYNQRSVHRDLESQVVLLTTSTVLKQRLAEEWQHLSSNAEPVSVPLLTQSSGSSSKQQQQLSPLLRAAATFL
jgi:CDP-diacylglycerol---glycerol-3-phosphate 3-phosphatidyltransferase